ncbi:MAG: hypothetical protein V9G19_20880 [Tetrasphaera sp.]
MTAALELPVPIEITRHLSTRTGRRWEAVDSVYYDCHVVSLAQLLPPELFGSFLAVTARPVIDAAWGGLRCRSILDSEAARDVVLMDRWGVWKSQVPVRDDVASALRDAVRTHGYCIARVDSYYHEHFEEYYLREHRTNGHKVTIIDYDDDSYTGIDNVGVKNLVLRFDRRLFEHAIRSNLVHVYEKPDTLYHLNLGQDTRAALASGRVDRDTESAVAAYLRDQVDLPATLQRYRQCLERDLAGSAGAGLDVDGYAQLRNSYTAALLIERSETAMIQASRFAPTAWERTLGDPTRLVAAVERAAKAWQLFKLLCNSGLSRRAVRVPSVFTALDRVIAAEAAAADIAAGADISATRGLQPWMQPR